MALRNAVLAVALVVSVLCAGTAAYAQSAVDQRALDILKEMSDTLEKATSLGFKARSLTPVRAPNGMWVSLFGESRVVMEEPDKLYVERRGDAAPVDFYFDGKTMTVYSPAKNVYAAKASSGTIDELIERLDREGDGAFPYADILISDPYAQMTANLSAAAYVGKTVLRDEVTTAHLAFVNKSVQWQIWINETDHLPVMVQATYLDRAGEPSYAVEFFDWKLNEAVPAGTFMYTNTTEAAKVEYRAPKGGRS